MVRIFIFSLLVVFASSCSSRKGCTDCNATNFSKHANSDNETCTYLNTNRIGVYLVHDSIMGPPTPEWENRIYQIEILRSTCAPENLLISNFSNQFTAEITVVDSVYQVLPNISGGPKIRQTAGAFSNDSIYGAFEYENDFGEVFYGNFVGVKQP